jgi:hypothetical protein
MGCRTIVLSWVHHNFFCVSQVEDSRVEIRNGDNMLFFAGDGNMGTMPGQGIGAMGPMPVSGIGMGPVGTDAGASFGMPATGRKLKNMHIP